MFLVCMVRLRHVALFSCCLALAGCGGASDQVPVSGKVTLDGKPLPNVQLIFYLEESDPPRTYVGETDAAGNYSLRGPGNSMGAAPGSYSVNLTTAFLGPEQNEMDPIPKELVPSAFRRIEFDVPPEGTSEANFELTSR